MSTLNTKFTIVLPRPVNYLLNMGIRLLIKLRVDKNVYFEVPSLLVRAKTLYEGKGVFLLPINSRTIASNKLDDYDPVDSVSKLKDQ